MTKYDLAMEILGMFTDGHSANPQDWSVNEWYTSDPEYPEGTTHIGDRFGKVVALIDEFRSQIIDELKREREQ